MVRRYIESAGQMVPVSAYASVALEECRRSADFMTMDTVNSKKCHIVTYLPIEKASFLKINDINEISFFGTPDYHHFCSIA
jgi:hypothetical protein